MKHESFNYLRAIVNEMLDSGISVQEIRLSIQEKMCDCLKDPSAPPSTYHTTHDTPLWYCIKELITDGVPINHISNFVAMNKRRIGL